MMTPKGLPIFQASPLHSRLCSVILRTISVLGLLNANKIFLTSSKTCSCCPCFLHQLYCAVAYLSFLVFPLLSNSYLMYQSPIKFTTKIYLQTIRFPCNLLNYGNRTPYRSSHIRFASLKSNLL